MKKQVWLMPLIFAVLLFAMVTAAFAADNTVVYLKDGGSGNGLSPDSAAGSLTAAFDVLKLSEDCTVVVCGPFTQSDIFNYGKNFTGSVTVTSLYDGVDYRKSGATYRVSPTRFVCFGETKFENIDFTVLDSSFLVVGQHNPVTIGTGVTVKGDKTKINGTTVAKSFCILGGYHTKQGNAKQKDREDTHITVLSGSNLYVVPFSRNISGAEYTGTAHITIGGSAQVRTLHGSAIGADGNKVGKVEVHLKDNASVGTFYGCTSNITEESFTLNWESGSIDKFYWDCPSTPGKHIIFSSGTKLIASAAVQENANYQTIAANFDSVKAAAPSTEGKKLYTTLYLRAGGSGDGTSADKALGSLDAVFAALDSAKDCTVVVCGEFTQSGDCICKPYTGKVTFTSVYGGKDYRKDGAVYRFDPVKLVCGGEIAFENIDFAANSKGMVVVGQHHPVTVGEGVTVTGSALTGGTIANSFAILGGYHSGLGDPPAEDTTDTNITVLSGSKIYVVAFSRSVLGYFTGTAHITIGGSASVGTVNGSAAYPDNIVVGDVELTLKDNAIINNFYGCTQNTTAGGFTLRWEGGDIANFYWDCPSTPGKHITYQKDKTLIASDAAKAQPHFAAVAANFNGASAGGDAADTRVMPTLKNALASAAALHELNLLQGKGTHADGSINYDVDGVLTRAESIVQVIRFLGVEAKAKAENAACPFTDVPAWATAYIGYAYANGITSGRSATQFDPNGIVDEAQFLTLLLRAAGYSDAAGEFVWNNPFALAKKIGMTSHDAAGGSFRRGGAFDICFATLYATAKNGSQVFENLAEAGVFTIDGLAAAEKTAQSAVTSTKATKEGDYYVLPVERYVDKTKLALLGQAVGFLSGYEFVYDSTGMPMLAMPDEWFELCNGPYAGNTAHKKNTDKLLYNEKTGLWEVWMDDDYSIDILNQYILRDMYAKYGTFASKVALDDWVNYDVWDMGGGHRTQGAYGLMSRHRYLPVYSGNLEYGNRFSYCGEPYIANETLGMDAAGLPNVAVDMARVLGGITSECDPREWLQIYAAMYAMAYYEDDVPTLIRTAEKVLPENSWQRQVIDLCFELHEKYPDDWRRAVVNADRICYRTHFNNDSRMGETSVNNALMILGLLYGEGDFYETCRILSLAGHGGDSTTPSVLSIVGVITGWENLDNETKSIINEKIWQDGKGVFINDKLSESSAYWMYMASLPLRMDMADILSMYQQNFENILLENGGKIENGNYYIPVTTLAVTDTVFCDDFESGKLDGYKTTGGGKLQNGGATGLYAASVSGAGSGAGSVYKTLENLTVGAAYRVTAYATTAANTVADIFARESGKGEFSAFVTVYDQPDFVKRELVFTATAAKMDIGLFTPADTADTKFAAFDDIAVIRIAETKVADVTPTAFAGQKLTGKVNFTVSGKADREVYLKLTFANPGTAIFDAAMTVNDAPYANIPFYKTGADAENTGANAAYIPILLQSDTTTITLDLGANALYISGAEVVTVTDRW